MKTFNVTFKNAEGKLHTFSMLSVSIYDALISTEGNLRVQVVNNEFVKHEIISIIESGEG